MMEETSIDDLPETPPDNDPSLLAEHFHPDTCARDEDVVRLKDHELRGALPLGWKAFLPIASSFLILTSSVLIGFDWLPN